MENLQTFISLYLQSNTQEIIPFLRNLPKEEHKRIIQETDRIRKVKAKRERNGGNSVADDVYDGYITLAQEDILCYCNFFCLGKNDLRRIEFVWRDLPKFEQMEQLLEEHIPDEFPELYAQVLVNRLNRVTYEDSMRWMRKGYLDKEALKPFLTMRLTEVFPRDLEIGNAAEFISGRLTEYPEILEQIPDLFEYPHEVSYSDKLSKTKIGKMGPWTFLFKTCMQNGQLDRMKFFRACMQATNQSFKKDQLNWYVDLFEDMEPTNGELLALQDELLASLSSTLSKLVNMSLGMIRKICREKEFRKVDFLQSVPALLASDGKATLMAALAILAELAKKDEAGQEDICLLVATAFLSKDEAVQTRIAKLIAAYGDPASATLRTAFLLYDDAILMAVKPLLADFLSDTGTANAPTPQDITETAIQIRTNNRMTYINDKNEFIFQLGQSISNFSPVDFYVIPEALVRLQDAVTEEVLNDFAPVIQQAYKRIDPWDPTRSHFLDLMCHFFLDYCKILFGRFPAGNKIFAKTREKSLQIIDWSEQRRDYRNNNFPHPAFTGFELLMEEYLAKVVNNDRLPLLSTPTHTPAWLDPAVLIARLKQYQDAGQEPSTMDMQQALQLCSLQSPETILPMIRQELTGEYRDLLAWYYDPATPLPGNRPHPAWWLTAAMMQTGRDIPKELSAGFETFPDNLLAGKFTAEPYIHEYIGYTQFNPETQQQEPVWQRSPHIEIELKKLYGKDTAGTTLFAGHSFSWTDRRLANISNLMLAMPNKWQTQLAYLLSNVLQYSSDAADKHVIPVLDIYRKANVPLHSLDMTLLTLCMISADKTVRAYVGDTWATLAQLHLLDNRELGQTIGTFERIEYAPLKRFTELVEKHLLGQSPFLNRALEEMLSGCIAQLPKMPVPNLKKLLEIYYEVVSLNTSRFDPANLPHLKAWQEEPNLKKVISSLLRR